jgi:DNA-binding SARP family transcriptional activator
MPRLTLRLLGPVEVALDGEPVTGLAYEKVRALLAYLAVESDRPHHRDTLAVLLWPDQPDAGARKNLRGALATLRRAIDDHNARPPFLHCARDTLQFNRAGDHSLDVAAFAALLDGAIEL